MTDAQLLDLFAEDRYLMTRLDEIQKSSIQYPSEHVDKDAPTMDGTTRALVLLLEAGLMS